MRLTLSYDRLAGLGHRSNIFDADMYRPCQISSSPLHPTLPSGGLGIRCSCFIRWRYSILGSKFYFCLIP